VSGRRSTVRCPMSIADQFWQYAREALLSACEAKTADDRKGLLELAQTWTQAALVERGSLIDNEIADREDCRIRQPPEFSTLLISPQCPLSADFVEKVCGCDA
jgi:hypothetical protein